MEPADADVADAAALHRVVAALLAVRSWTELEQDTLPRLGRELGVRALAIASPARGVAASWGAESRRSAVTAAALARATTAAATDILVLDAGTCRVAIDLAAELIAPPVLTLAAPAFELALERAVAHRDAYRMARFDRGTRLADREHVAEMIEREVDICRRRGRSSTLIAATAIDLNAHRAVAAGAVVPGLTEVALAVADVLRSTDLVALRGADGFLALLGDVDAAAVEKIAWRILREVMRASRPSRFGYVLGVATMPPWPKRGDCLMASADVAVREAEASAQPFVVASSHPRRVSPETPVAAVRELRVEP